MDYTELESARRQLVDAEFRAFKASSDALLDTYEKLAETSLQLAGFQSSPRIKSIAESKYQKSAGPASSTDIVGLTLRKEALSRKYVQLEFRMNRMARFLETLDPEQIQLLTLVYEDGWSIKAAADLMNISRRKATYMMNEIRQMYWDYG